MRAAEESSASKRGWGYIIVVIGASPASVRYEMGVYNTCVLRKVYKGTPLASNMAQTITYSEIHEIALEVLEAVDEASPITEEIWDTFYNELVKATRYLRQ